MTFSQIGNITEREDECYRESGMGCVNRAISIYLNSTRDNKHDFDAQRSKYKFLYEFIPLSLTVMLFVSD